MALGGGNFTSQNKVLPGAYLNFVSVARATAALSDRGIVALPVQLDWGIDGEVFEVEAADLEKNSLKLFGYSYDTDALKGIRDMFLHAKKCFFFRMINNGLKAANVYGEAKYKGTKGNELKIVIAVNVDDSNKFDVDTYLGTTKVDSQTVAEASELAENDYMVPKKDATLAATSGTAFTGGSNGDTLTGTEWQNALDKLESYSFNVLGCLSDVATIQALFVAYTKRMRDEVGVKFQTVVYRRPADTEGVISLKNTVKDTGADVHSLVYWVAGVAAGCAVNESNTNERYDGEYVVDTDYKQSALETAINNGEYVFHKVGTDVRILSDINSLVTVTETKNADFKENQVIRVLDQIGNDIAAIFNTRYLGKVQNDASGRVSLWGDIVSYGNELLGLRAIEDFSGDDITVEAGTEKKAVAVTGYFTPVCAMAKLYMTVMVQ